jgi:hypothetical protein
MTHSHSNQSGTTESMGSTLALTFVTQRKELFWLAFLLTGDRSLSLETVTEAAEWRDSSDPFFRNWMVSWARKLVIVRARSAMDGALSASARRLRQRQAAARLEAPQPVDWTLGESDKMQLERALLAIDLLPRWVLLLTVFERVSLDEAATLLRVDHDLVAFARTVGLMELSRNMAREQGWISALTSLPGAPAMAAN